MSAERPQLRDDALAVLQAWCEHPSHFLPSQQVSRIAARSRSTPSSGGGDGGVAGRRRYSPAEVSQRSVDLLLREYYNMVQAQQHAPQAMGSGSSGGGLLQSVFLLLCPAGPAWLDVHHVFKASVWLLSTAASAAALLACVFVPLWLGVIRHQLQQQGLASAAATAIGGVAALLACTAVHNSSRAASQAARASSVVPGNLAQLAPGEPSNEVAALRRASKTVTTSNNSRLLTPRGQPGAAAAAAAAVPAPASPTAAAAAPRGGSGGGGGSSSSSDTAAFAALMPELHALQAALGISAASGGAPAGAGERAAHELARVCEVLGVAVAHDALATPAGMAAKVAELKRDVGI